MELSSSRPAAALYPPLIQRTFVLIGEAWSVVQRARLAPLSQHRTRDSRLPDVFANMNVHMLKDIGAPDWLIDRAVAERDRR